MPSSERQQLKSWTLATGEIIILTCGLHQLADYTS